MQPAGSLDLYETLQVSPNADPETIHRIYRILAQRFHPDNQDTGNAPIFQALTTAYHVLGDPENAPPTMWSIARLAA